MLSSSISEHTCTPRHPSSSLAMFFNFEAAILSEAGPGPIYGGRESGTDGLLGDFVLARGAVFFVIITFLAKAVMKALPLNLYALLATFPEFHLQFSFQDSEKGSEIHE